LLKDLLETAIPTTDQDVIVVFATASGLRGGRLVQHSYSARIVGAPVAGHTLSAIQLTTAAGICTALDLVAQGRLPQKGFVGQEAVPLADFLDNRFGVAYAGGAVAVVA
jgi:saccharopine dehydrogenase-like NADP-dependent oxidoreductase